MTPNPSKRSKTSPVPPPEAQTTHRGEAEAEAAEGGAPGVAGRDGRRGSDLGVPRAPRAAPGGAGPGPGAPVEHLEGVPLGGERGDRGGGEAVPGPQMGAQDRPRRVRGVPRGAPAPPGRAPPPPGLLPPLVRRLLVFAQAYLAIYFATLAATALATGLEPLRLFYATSPGAYAWAQAAQSLGYVAYLVLQLVDLVAAFPPPPPPPTPHFPAAAAAADGGGEGVAGAGAGADGGWARGGAALLRRGVPPRGGGGAPARHVARARGLRRVLPRDLRFRARRAPQEGVRLHRRGEDGKKS
uniref:Uncharacterized protein n=1 Tax=Ananas comosus var. bracteatus TaxID=296719 RepID=A0A6V7P6Q0_ANACO|nr:unnamed protein product [Ananas comosus var. bracteatus]